LAFGDRDLHAVEPLLEEEIARLLLSKDFAGEGEHRLVVAQVLAQLRPELRIGPRDALHRRSCRGIWHLYCKICFTSAISKDTKGGDASKSGKSW